MGQKTEILLVTGSPVLRLLILAGLFLTIAGCENNRDIRVNAEDHEAFWLWAGVEPQPVLDRAKTIYILEGEVRAPDPSRLVSLRPAVPRVEHAEVWMVVRVETLRWSPRIHQRILGQLEHWSAAGNRLAGLQIDFDAQTRELDGYAEFLRDVRERMPDHFKLSVTGLLDWRANGDPDELANIAATVDEVVLQTYQGRSTIAGYEKWLKKLDKLPMPFRIGLVQGGQWEAPARLDRNPNFLGYVVFLTNPADPH